VTDVDTGIFKESEIYLTFTDDLGFFRADFNGVLTVGGSPSNHCSSFDVASTNPAK
jgi:hypothetical protein